MTDTTRPTDADLVDAAREALADAYVPYSEYRVGAALLTGDGTVKNGHADFERIAVSSGVRDGVTPCGMCRQTLAEFCDDDLVVVCDEGERVSEYTLGELLPNTISLDTLDAAERAGGDDSD
jgi:cytidine deaminase